MIVQHVVFHSSIVVTEFVFVLLQIRTGALLFRWKLRYGRGHSLWETNTPLWWEIGDTWQDPFHSKPCSEERSALKEGIWRRKVGWKWKNLLLLGKGGLQNDLIDMGWPFADVPGGWFWSGGRCCILLTNLVSSMQRYQCRLCMFCDRHIYLWVTYMPAGNRFENLTLRIYQWQRFFTSGNHWKTDLALADPQQWAEWPKLSVPKRPTRESRVLGSWQPDSPGRVTSYRRVINRGKYMRHWGPQLIAGPITLKSLKNSKKRVEFCQNLRYWMIKDFRRVTWSEESMPDLDHSFNLRNNREWANERASFPLEIDVDMDIHGYPRISI